jgi:hypothetical protein
MSLPIPRALRLAAGLTVLSAFALSPIAAQAAETNLEGAVTGGALSNTAPVITPFAATLTGVSQTVKAKVGAWNVTDATGSNVGYSVTVAASEPTIGGSAAGTGTGSSVTFTPATATASAGNAATTGPVAAVAQALSPVAATIENAPAGSGQGEWGFAANAGEGSLAVVIPGNASAGAYASTLTFTTAPPAA